jgi:membrane-bound lytic murein transglycosylase D
MHKWYKLNLLEKKVNDRKNRVGIAIAILLIIFLWGCSSHSKPPVKTTTAPTQEPAEEETVLEIDRPEAKSEVIQNKKEEIAEEPEMEDLPVEEEPFLEEQTEPSRLLEEAFDAYQDARLAWDKGDLETALAALDAAYSILLKLDLPMDSPLIQEKNDLRLLIARRIQEIHASRFTAVNGTNGTIPLTENEHVAKEIKSFQTVERKEFEQAYARSGLYINIIREKMMKAGLPEELSWMPMIESWFKVTAYSRARALGLWQFISSTGARFGLKRDRWIDERMDFEKATDAAIKYLDELHSMFGDWTTALAAYNCGEFRVQRTIRSQRLEYMDNFWDLYLMLPRETSRFVPRFIATLLIIRDPAKYGFSLPPPESPLSYDTVQINRPVKLSSLSSALGLAAGSLVLLNPELRNKSTPDSEYEIRVPKGHGDKVMVSLDSLSRYIPPEATYRTHYVRRGETVSVIAGRYGTSVSAIARANRLGRNYLIRAGQSLRIPVQGSSSASYSSRTLTKDGEQLVYTVKKGDSLYIIAKAFNTTVQEIQNHNNLQSNILHVGQKLVIQSGTPKGAVPYTVQSGDTPYQIAKKYGMNLAYLLALNGLSTRSKIYPGQQLWVVNGNDR